MIARTMSEAIDEAKKTTTTIVDPRSVVFFERPEDARKVFRNFRLKKSKKANRNFRPKKVFYSIDADSKTNKIFGSLQVREISNFQRNRRTGAGKILRKKEKIRKNRFDQTEIFVRIQFFAQNPRIQFDESFAATIFRQKKKFRQISIEKRKLFSTWVYRKPIRIVSKTQIDHRTFEVFQSKRNRTIFFQNNFR